MVFHAGDNRRLHHIPPELLLPAPWRSRPNLVDIRCGVGPDQRLLRSGKQNDANRLTNLAERGKGPRYVNLWHPRNVRESALETLQRWETAGGRWEVLSRSPVGVIVALLRCDGGEEVHRLTSPDPDLVTYIGDRETSKQ